MSATVPASQVSADMAHDSFSPIWNPEFFGNMIMVNGNTWPFQTVEQRRYRIRFLNGCDSRFLILDFSGIPGVEVWQIGNEGGFLAAPVNITALGNQLLMDLAERADMIVDFTNVPVGNYVLGNVGPDAPLWRIADRSISLWPIRHHWSDHAVPGCACACTRPHHTANVPATAAHSAASTPEPITRPLALMEEMSMQLGRSRSGDAWHCQFRPYRPVMGMAMHKMWMDPVTENPKWATPRSGSSITLPPMHIPCMCMRSSSRLLIDRPITFTEDMGHIMDVQLAGAARPPEAWESGFKDTVTAYPGEVTRVKAQFLTAGQFTWHCHIVSHEDNEMMRPYRIGPLQPGQPTE